MRAYDLASHENLLVFYKYIFDIKDIELYRNDGVFLLRKIKLRNIDRLRKVRGINFNDQESKVK